MHMYPRRSSLLVRVFMFRHNATDPLGHHEPRTVQEQQSDGVAGMLAFSCQVLRWYSVHGCEDC